MTEQGLSESSESSGPLPPSSGQAVSPTSDASTWQDPAVTGTAGTSWQEGTSGGAHAADGSSADGGRAHAAKEEASSVAQSAAGNAKQVADEAAAQARDVAGTAKEQVKNTAAEARQQARSLYEQGRQQVSDQAGVQQERLAGGMRSVASELSSMADSSQEQGLASSLTRQVADYLGQAGEWLEQRDPGQVMEEISSYARRHPVSFMAIAAGLGLVVGRVARSAKDASTQDDTSAGTSTTSTGLSGAGLDGSGTDQSRTYQASTGRSAPYQSDLDESVVAQPGSLQTGGVDTPEEAPASSPSRSDYVDSAWTAPPGGRS